MQVTLKIVFVIYKGTSEALKWNMLYIEMLYKSLFARKGNA